MKEIWKDVPLFEGIYQISNTGKLMSFHKNKDGRILGSLRGDGYIGISLWRDRRLTLIMSLHRLIALVFIPNPMKKPCVNHKDFNRSNNFVNNLEWVTDKENTEYSRDNLYLKKGRKGESHPRSIFTDRQFEEMVKLRNEGKKYSQIAKIFNAKQNTILQIFRRDGYRKPDNNHIET